MARRRESAVLRTLEGAYPRALRMNELVSTGARFAKNEVDALIREGSVSRLPDSTGKADVYLATRVAGRLADADIAAWHAAVSAPYRCLARRCDCRLTFARGLPARPPKKRNAEAAALDLPDTFL
jgi:hypothetical protein